MGIRALKFISIPQNMDYTLFLSSFLGKSFAIYHNFHESETFLLTDQENAETILAKRIVGLRLDNSSVPTIEGNLRHIIGFDVRTERESYDEEKEKLFSDMYKILGNSKNWLLLFFSQTTERQVNPIKRKVEDLLSRREIRLTRNFGARYETDSGSMQNELHYASEEKKALFAILNSLDSASLANGSSYKVSFVMSEEAEDVYNYLKMKILLVEEERIKAVGIAELCNTLKKKESLPVSHDVAARLLSFSDRIRQNSIIESHKERQEGEIALGTYLDGSVRDTGEPVKIFASTLNLGTLITGLPGSGKTFGAMSLIDQISENCKAKVVIIAPTEEWIPFGIENKMEVVKLYGYGSRINFFKCNYGLSVERFYENLAMLVAHASNSGPYKNSIEKCLLSAFSRVYAATRNPDPVEVYGEIEEAVIEQHGKRSNVGVKYTKHGENIRAGLESLKLMLQKPQFAYKDGIELSEVFDKGAVFDLSKVSNNMKPFYYALILNQIYAYSDTFDLNGDDKLRLLICLEEAQLVFDNNEQSAATMDLRQRIQDFRKKGVGLVLIAHNVTEINLRIRRLCQTKMYFRQSADAVKIAAGDLIFNESLSEEICNKLKTLEHRACALNYMALDSGTKSPASSIFVKTPTYSLKLSKSGMYDYPVPKTPETEIRIVNAENKPISDAKVEIQYVGERTCSGKTDEDGVLLVKNLLEAKKYALVVLGQKKKDAKKFDITGGEVNIIRLETAKPAQESSGKASS